MRDKTYFLEPYRGRWRLRRKGNRQGTSAGSRETLVAIAADRGYRVEEESSPLSPEEFGRAFERLGRFGGTE